MEREHGRERSLVDRVGRDDRIRMNSPDKVAHHLEQDRRQRVVDHAGGRPGVGNLIIQFIETRDFADDPIVTRSAPAQGRWDALVFERVDDLGRAFLRVQFVQGGGDRQRGAAVAVARVGSEDQDAFRIIHRSLP